MKKISHLGKNVYWVVTGVNMMKNTSFYFFEGVSNFQIDTSHLFFFSGRESVYQGKTKLHQ